MKKNQFLFACILFLSNLVFSQAPGVLPTGNVDGLRPVKPTQAIKPFVDIKPIKPNIVFNNKPTECDQTIPIPKKFKSLALNTRNGGVWFIGDDDRLYGVGYHFQNCALVTITGNSKVENLTSNYGAVLVRSKAGLGMMRGGNHDPEHVRKITMPSGAPFPAPNSTYVYTAAENTDELWYLNEKGFIKSAATTNNPPEKFAKMFTVYATRFFMIDENQDLYMWKPGFSSWRKMGDIKAVFLTTEIGISTPLWYIGTDNQVYMLSTEEPTPTPMNAKAKSIAVFGSQLYYIGLDGYFYVRLKNKDFRIDM